MTYPLLKRKDKLPMVGVTQKLLNRTGASLTPDGIYGPKTKKAVRSFQSLRKLKDDGVVGKNTWPRLVGSESNMQVIDCVDIFDPSLYNLETKDIRKVGGNPILIGGMSNGVEQAVFDILTKAKKGCVCLLRFHGHGASGNVGISEGQGGIAGEHYSSIHTGNVSQLLPVLRRLRPIFSKYGNVQFMHCSTGKGPKGRQLLNTIANNLRVPVSAGTKDQLGGGLTTFRFEGSTFTAIPRGTLKTWSKGLPDFPFMTVR